MKLVDVNLLLYAVNEDAPHHPAAKSWLEDALSERDTFGLSWPVIMAFVRLTTSPVVFPQPLGVGEAFDQVDSWLRCPNTVIAHPTGRHFAILRRLLEPLGAAANLSTDAHLAALAIEHGAELYSADGDFARFPGLYWVNPLA